jgi:hypothetical protein
LEVENGQGDRVTIAFNNAVESVDGLPKQAVHGTRIRVQPDPTSDKGIYWLEATGTAENATKSPDVASRKMQEVIWAESRDPDQKFTFDEDTMPHVAFYNSTLNQFEVGTPSVGWDDRQSGSDISVKRPKFVDTTIEWVDYFQKRLVFISDNDVTMSKTDDIYNFWKQSAVTLLTSDPVSVASSATNADVLKYSVPHNRDLMIVASNGQYKIDGNTAVTPETISMPQVTAYEVQTSIKPVSMGNSIFLPITYGTSSGLLDYSGEAEKAQDIGYKITDSIIGYMKGNIEGLAASSNLEMIAVLTDGAPNNEIFVYDQVTVENKGVQQRAWSRWLLPTDEDILDVEFTRDRLSILTRNGDDIFLKQLNMYSRTTVNTEEVFLDDLLILSSDGVTVELPVDYPTNDIIIVRGVNTDYPLNIVDYTVDGTTVTFDESISTGTCEVYVGKLFTSRYIPSRPFVHEAKEGGEAVTTDRLRIQRYWLNVVNTNSVKMKIISDYYDFEDQEFNGRLVGDLSNLIGEVPFFTGDVQFSYAQDAELAEAEFYTDGFLGLNIVGISWAGQYNKTHRRL